MIEKVNPQHPDKIADRIAGTLVDYCYTKDDKEEGWELGTPEIGK